MQTYSAPATEQFREQFRAFLLQDGVFLVQDGVFLVQDGVFECCCSEVL